MPEKIICKATTAQGQPCKARAEDGFTVCRWHGGRGGQKSHNGRWSRFLPRDIAERVEEVKDDPDLLRLESDVELSTALLDAELESYALWVDTGTEPTWWEAFNEAQTWNERLAQPISLEQAFQERIGIQRKFRGDILKAHHQIETTRHKMLTVREAEAMIAYLVAETQRLIRDDQDRTELLASFAGYLRGEVIQRPGPRLIEGG